MLSQSLPRALTAGLTLLLCVLIVVSAIGVQAVSPEGATGKSQSIERERPRKGSHQ